jgi:hypothetical protein
MASHPNDCEPVKSGVGLPVAAAVQSKAMGFYCWTRVLGRLMVMGGQNNEISYLVLPITKI